jgi:hypothetical protein
MANGEPYLQFCVVRSVLFWFMESQGMGAVLNGGHIVLSPAERIAFTSGHEQSQSIRNSDIDFGVDVRSVVRLVSEAG